jgi:hypothetical protein
MDSSDCDNARDKFCHELRSCSVHKYLLLCHRSARFAFTCRYHPQQLVKGKEQICQIHPCRSSTHLCANPSTHINKNKLFILLDQKVNHENLLTIKVQLPSSWMEHSSKIFSSSFLLSRKALRLSVAARLLLDFNSFPIFGGS